MLSLLVTIVIFFTDYIFGCLSTVPSQETFASPLGSLYSNLAAQAQAAGLPQPAAFAQAAGLPPPAQLAQAAGFPQLAELIQPSALPTNPQVLPTFTQAQPQPVWTNPNPLPNAPQSVQANAQSQVAPSIQNAEAQPQVDNNPNPNNPSTQQQRQPQQRQRGRKGRKKPKRNEDDPDEYYYYYDAPQGQGEGDTDLLYDYYDGSQLNNQPQQSQGQEFQANQQQQEAVQSDGQQGNQQLQQTETQQSQMQSNRSPERNRNVCTSPQDNETTFFIPCDAQSLPTYGQLLPRNDSCICSSGMEYTYVGSPMSISSNGSLTDIIGSFYCHNNSELCVEDVFGRQWRPAQADNLITILPSNACMEGGRYHRCGVFLLFVASRPSPTSDMVTSTMEGIRYHDMYRDGKFVHFADYVYVPIKGFSCNSCRERYCRPHQRFI